LGCAKMDSACVSFGTGLPHYVPAFSFVKIAPNPGKGLFAVEFSGEGFKRIEVIDAMGKLIQQTETNIRSAAINISSFADGIYYARILSDENFTVIKLIKE